MSVSYTGLQVTFVTFGTAQLVERIPGLTLCGSGMQDRSWSRAPPMLICKYVDDHGSAAMLAAKG